MKIRYIVGPHDISSPIAYFRRNQWYINFNGTVWRLWDKFDRFGVNSNDYHHP